MVQKHLGLFANGRLDENCRELAISVAAEYQWLTSRTQTTCCDLPKGAMKGVLLLVASTVGFKICGACNHAVHRCE